VAIEDFGTSYVTHNLGSVTYGWSFTVTKPTNLQSLGIWDYNLDGLGESHGIGIWREDGTSLAMTTITQGTLGEVVGEFRFQDLPSAIPMRPGHTYVIGIRFNGIDHFHAQFAGSTPDFAPEVVYEDARYYIHPDLGTMAAFPETVAPAREWIVVGANFRFIIIPEPQSAVLTCIGLGFLSSIVRCRRVRRD
jgi:hypothetical protein